MDAAFDRLARRLAARPAAELDPAAFPGRAAVAIVLRPAPGAPEVLLMRRTEHPGDVWSGHVSLPGGREEQGDESLFATAVRETREEVGLDLVADGQLLGRLEPVPARARGKFLPLAIVPFVFARAGNDPLTLGAEAVAAFWFPLAGALAGAFSATMTPPTGEPGRVLPCWRYEGQVIWGLTFEMLRSLLRLLSPADPR
ncbi:MAG: CoA pyrophosphatase [Planctomycetota bacterium]